MNQSGGIYVCPRCQKPDLKPCLDGGIAFLRCFRCEGAYFRDEFDLERYVKAKRGLEAGNVYSRLLLMSMADAETTRVGRRVCPIEYCSRRLRHHPFGSPPFMVVLDRCDLHGFWLDKEEVEMVLAGCQELAAKG